MVLAEDSGQVMFESKQRLLDTHRIIRPDQVETIVPARVLAEGAVDRGPRRRVSFRDYESLEPGQARVPGIDRMVLIIYRNEATRLRRRVDEGWKDEHIRAGSLAVIGGGRPTELEWHGHTSISHVYLPNDLMADTAAALGQDYRRLEIIDPLHFENQSLQALGDALIWEMRAPGGGTNLLVDSLASSLSIYLLRHCHRNSRIPAIIRGEVRLTLAQRTRVLDFIEANISRNFRLVELAAVAGLSEVHFGRCFTNTFGESPHQFVLKQRTQLAIEWICQTEMAFAEIADLTGFAGQAHLTRAVKKATGYTPRVLRRS
jgi:AraC family transcriptional regulator